MNYYDYISFPAIFPIFWPQPKSTFETICLIASSFAPTAAIIYSMISYCLLNRKRRKEEILLMNDHLLDLAIKYPYLEDDNFCKTWTGDYCDNWKMSRYNLYCCKVYNLLLAIYEYSGSYRKMSEIVDIDDYISTHRVWLKMEASKTAGNDRFNSLLHERIAKIIE